MRDFRAFGQIGEFLGSKVRNPASGRASNAALPMGSGPVVVDDWHFEIIALPSLKAAIDFDGVAASTVRSHPIHVAASLLFNC